MCLLLRITCAFRITSVISRPFFDCFRITFLQHFLEKTFFFGMKKEENLQSNLQGYLVSLQSNLQG